MASSFQQVLTIIRDRAINTTELGTAFEKLCKVFFENDATQKQQYSKVWHYKDWARLNLSFSQADTGIDLVAELRDGTGLCAIQCKFYNSEFPIKKEDLDSFISASVSNVFKRLVLIDTSTVDLGKHAESTIRNLNKDYLRIQMSELEECRIDWLTYIRENRVRLHSQKTLRDHQVQALTDVEAGLEESDRGKLVLACGTGKTFTSLRIAEKIAGKSKRVLYMVPSLALMSQTVREWKNDAIEDFTAFSACSDVKVGKKNSSDDAIEVNLSDLAFPATTDAEKLSEQVTKADPEKMTVVFSTYHSIEVISKAQFEHSMPEFDLIVCDEAHRTTGATLVGEDESNFVRIHSNDNVKGKKRLYMTATPRIFGETAKQKAEDGKVDLASMDNEALFGKTLFYKGFGWAVENNLLTDYKVVVLAMDEGLVSERIQKSFMEGSELKLDDATKIIGCYKALAKVGFADGKKDDLDSSDHVPMKRALAFAQNIKLSQMFAAEFTNVVNEYAANEKVDDAHKTDLAVELRHVDGTFNAEQRNYELNWLKDDIGDNTCRVLTNARCLSEGVDVPSLDAIMFLHPRKSQIDVVQSVGRVMRLAEGKKLGYVILPITVAPGVSPERALNDNEKYKVVWQILNALRAHDERFDSTINRIGLGEDVSDRIEIIGVGPSSELEATTAVVEDVKPKKKRVKSDNDDEGEGDGEDSAGVDGDEQYSFVIGDLTSAIRAKIVDKCGTRDYWENWASSIAKIAQAHITRINKIVLNSGTAEREAFMEFVTELRDDLNSEVTESDAVEMLAQHLITKPVFDSLFAGNKFTAENAVSKAMEKLLEQLYNHNIENESDELNRFYESVKRRAADIMTTTGRQTLVLELYDRFFRNAFPNLVQKLGIVYTPVEVVDFIVHSVNDILKQEFGQTLGSKGVHIIDPFTGTGTFITRLMQSGLISKEDLAYKYKNEIHANEIVLLAYYIAAINIESVYQDIARENQYQPFNGIVLTDTFKMYESEDLIAKIMPDNSERRKRQKALDIRVIIGNPPYSAKQASGNDNNANVQYAYLDQEISKTYAHGSKAVLKNALYDSYIRAIRWGSERLGDAGVMAYVTNAGWVDSNAMDGMRRCLEAEFSSIYILHLRGNIRKNMLTKGRAGEGENIFGSGSMTGAAIAIFVKNPASPSPAKIHFYDIGNDKRREEKLSFLSAQRSLNSLTEAAKWQLVSPNEQHDWIGQRSQDFGQHARIANRSNETGDVIFNASSWGVKTSRDAWCINYSLKKCAANMDRMIDFYNAEVGRLNTFSGRIDIDSFVNSDSSKISWTRNLKNDLGKRNLHSLDQSRFTEILYRPFCKQWIYFDRTMNSDVGKIDRFFGPLITDNLAICGTGIGEVSEFSVIMSGALTELKTNYNGQNFPLKIYEKAEGNKADLFAGGGSGGYTERDGITDHGLKHFQSAYPNATINKEDIFYYVYGLLHSAEYRTRFADNLSKQLPRIPCVKKEQDFWAFSQAGRKLGDLHVNYESVEPYPITYKEGDLRLANIPDPVAFYRVEQMKLAGKRPNLDKTTVCYNANITMTGIPLEAYEYVVNGKSALDWVMERQCVKTDKASGIVNDANDYANETMNNPAYPLELFQRVITVSLETMKIVRSLPKLDID